MRIHVMMKRFILLSFAMSFSAWATPLSRAADPLVEGVMVPAPERALGVVASGAVEDTLKTCMARIPEDASRGQRMLAEQDCASDEKARRSAQYAPNF